MCFVHYTKVKNYSSQIVTLYFIANMSYSFKILTTLRNLIFFFHSTCFVTLEIIKLNTKSKMSKGPKASRRAACPYL